MRGTCFVGHRELFLDLAATRLVLVNECLFCALAFARNAEAELKTRGVEMAPLRLRFCSITAESLMSRDLPLFHIVFFLGFFGLCGTMMMRFA
jgi:hypothetical protein